MPSNDRLTVLQLLPALDSGGVERGTLEVGKHLVENGHRSLVISAGGRMVEQLRQEGSTHFSWQIGNKSLWTLRHVGRLRSFLREQQVDILHARSRMPAWVAWLAWRGMEVVKRPRFVTTVHGLYSVNAYSAIMTRGEQVIAVSQTVRDYILDNYPTTEPDRIHVIPRGIDLLAYPHGYKPDPEWLKRWHARYPQLAQRKVLTLPGRITRLKGHEDFIELIARLRASGEAVHGLIVGGAEAKKQPYLAELQQAVQQRGLAGDITFTGQRGDLREIMAVSDVVLSLSSKPEAFGRTVLEALSIGIPVIGYAHGGVEEQLAHLHPQGQVALGDIDGLFARCRELGENKRIMPGAPLPTLATMLAATLSVYQEHVVV
jgi:glycosyltransferase involved in cell wall biosynthesis